MKILPTLLLTTLLTAPLLAGNRFNVAEDDASQGAYNNGWESGANGGGGFDGWTLRTASGEGESHAGFFIAQAAGQPELQGAAMRGKALGLYANGTGFESAVAFRTLKKPLPVGDSFSLMLESADIQKKFDSDDEATGSVGFTLRSGTAAESADDYNAGARFEFGHYEGQANYQIYDGEENHDSGVAVSDRGVTVTVTLVDKDHYDLEVTTPDKKTTKLGKRKLGGTAGAAIESLALFNRDGERSDAFFNGLQISREARK